MLMLTACLAKQFTSSPPVVEIRPSSYFFIILAFFSPRLQSVCFTY